MHPVFCISRFGFFTLIKSIAFRSQKKKNLSLKTISHKRLGGGVLVNIQLTNLLGDIM